MKIIHLTPHLGGGVGRVLLSYLSEVKKEKEQRHFLFSLDTINDSAKSLLDKKNIDYSYVSLDNNLKFKEELSASDILLIHWWNHPLLFDFLINFDFGKSRVVFWSHCSGLYPMYFFSEKLIDFSDHFVFTTPASYKAHEIMNLANESKKKLSVIWSTAGLAHILKRKDFSSSKHPVIGYVGSLDYSKLHSDFQRILKNNCLSDLKFRVSGAGADDSLTSFLKSKEQYAFNGWIDDVNGELLKCDIFGYPLSPFHFGTCDQVIAEAMATGLPVVAFNNEMEKIMIENNVTGFLCADIEEYVDAVNLLRDPERRKKMGERCINYAEETYRLDRMILEWNSLFELVLKEGKRIRKWKKNFPVEDKYSVFLESIPNGTELSLKNPESILLGNIKELIRKNPNWDYPSRGSIHQYAKYFSGDANLQKISKLFKQ